MNCLSSRGFLLTALLGMVAIYLYTQVELRVDPRPKGSLREIEQLSLRSGLNVVFVLVDTLRADRLGVYGYPRETSPGMDYLASSGVRFANHFAQSSWTKTSMASLWTGLYPNRVGVLHAQDSLSQEARTPAELFASQGYVTAGIWRNGWVAPNFGFDQGFGIYQNPQVQRLPAPVRRSSRAGRIDGTDIDIVFSAKEFLRTHRDEKFLLYLHFMDVHQYVTDEESATFGTSYSDAYDNAIHWVDRQLMAILAELERLELRERTLIVLASDHGEAFGEHGSEGHARDLHAEVTHTPFLLSLPFILDPGVVVEERTANVDIWPTVLELLGLPPLEVADGRSRVPEILGATRGAPRSGEVEFAQLDRRWARPSLEPAPLVAVRRGTHRLIHDVTQVGPDRLYDLARDPREFENVAQENPQLAAELADEVQHYLERDVVWEGGAPQVEIDDMELRHLRALGYVLD